MAKQTITITFSNKKKTGKSATKSSSSYKSASATKSSSSYKSKPKGGRGGTRKA